MSRMASLELYHSLFPSSHARAATATVPNPVTDGESKVSPALFFFYPL